MQNDLIKQIILKFKTEGSDQVKKVADSLSKSFNAKDTDKFLKSLDQIQAKFGKTGSGMSTELKKVTEYFKELNNQHFQKAERNLDRMGRLIKTQLENIERLKKEGASASDIKRRTDTMYKASQKFESMASETPYKPNLKGYLQDQIPGFKQVKEIGGMLGPGGKMIGGAALGIAGVASLVAAAAATVNEIKKESMQNRTYAAEAIKSQAMDNFNGNMSRALLYSNKQRREGIASDTKILNRSKDIETGARGIGGLVMTVGGGILGSAFGPLGTIAGAYAGSKVGGWLGLGGASDTVDAGKYFFGGGREVAKQQNRQVAEKKAESETMDLEYYKEFSKNAEMRYNYQRQLGLGDQTALDVRARFRAAGVLDEGQMASSMLGFRKFGSATAPFVAASTAEMAKTMGMSQESAQGLMQQVAGSNRGGIGSAKKDLEEIFRRAVSAGVNDSGLIEEYQKAAAGMMQTLGTRMSSSDIASSMNQFMLGGAGQREIAAIAPAMQAFGQGLKGTSNLMQAKSTAGLLGLARDDSGNVNMLAYQYLAGMSPQDLATLNENDPVLKQAGITSEKIQAFKKQQVMGTLKSNMGAQQGIALFNKAKAGNTSLSEGEQRQLAVGFGMSGVADQDIRTVQSFLKANLETAGGAGEGLTFAGPDGSETELNTVQTMTPEDVQKGIAGTDISAGTAVKAKGEGQTELDRKVYEKVSKNIDDVYQVFKEQSAQAMKDIDKNVLAGPISEIGDAADRIAKAMSDAADRIEGNSAHNRSSAKQPGD